MALGLIQPLTEMSTRNLPAGKEWPALKADDFTAICEPTVYKLWDPRSLTTLWASTAFTGIAWRVRLTTSLTSVSRLSKKMCEPRRLTNLRASTASYSIGLPFFTLRAV
jgi:hypothetical protein